MTQRQRNARDIRDNWMTTARYWRSLGNVERMANAVQQARQWGREVVRRDREAVS